MKICFLMYPWEKVDPVSDSTLRLIHEAHLRGHTVAISSPTKLTIRDTVAYAFCQVLSKKVKAKTAQSLHKAASFHNRMLPLAGFDVIFLRANPPVDPVALNFLDSVKDSVFIMNDVDGVRIANNKVYTAALNDPDKRFVPTTHVSKNRDYLERVLAEAPSDRMILKPLDGYGGSGVIVIERSASANIRSLLDFYLGEKEDRYVIMQDFVEGAEEGDVRILMLNGEPIGAMKRVPAEGELRANISRGGREVKHTLSREEKALCKHIGPKLVRDGLYFVGLDVIGGKLIEVNVLSPGGITRINRLNRVKLQQQVLDFAETVVRAKEVQAARKTAYRQAIEDAVAEG